ncbi:MAG: hypothetical protein ACTSRS_11705 [Candidatus Helarchaeota archaeon]
MQETAVWVGRESEDVRIRNLIIYLILIWLLTFGIFIPGEIISHVFGKYFLLSMLGPFLLSIVLLAIALSEKYGAGRSKYEVSTRRVRATIERKKGKHEELLLKNISRIELKKSWIDLKHKNTGTILFFIRGKEKSQMRFKHIERVNKVYELITHLLEDV